MKKGKKHNSGISEAYLLDWTPEGWDWEGKYKELCLATRQGGLYYDGWTCHSTQPRIGDEIFVEKLGTIPKGIMAHGRVVKTSFVHKDNDGEDHRYIGVDFDTILDCEKDTILMQERLKKMFPKQNWSPQGSGIEIRQEVLPGLRRIWNKEFSPEYSLNQILYGPPGTGKTYNTIFYAVAICDKLPLEKVKSEGYKATWKRYNELIKEGRIAFTTFHQSYSYEEFIEGIKPDLDSNGVLKYKLEDGTFKKFCEYARTKKAVRVNKTLLGKEVEEGIAETDKRLPCVYIIDEINRGNISKIFGELITLIEEAKREGAKEAMSAILPYSQTAFSVPDNVYILGTMNTADRSIALMDTALRRRFEFVEMIPNPDELGDMTVKVTTDSGELALNVSRMLEIINKRIEYIYDREHRIGHAFFMPLRYDNSIEKLAEIFEKKIIPLLQEYFYDDYEKIQLVLGDNGKENPDWKFIRDDDVKEDELFIGIHDLGLSEKRYWIQADAFRKIESYVSISKDLSI